MAENKNMTVIQDQKDENNMEPQVSVNIEETVEEENTVDTEKTVPNEVPEVNITEFLSNPEVKQAIELVRSQEKAKLYKTIKSKEEKINGLQDEIKRLQNILNERETENMGELEKFQKTITELQEETRELKEAQKIAQLEAYKEKRLREVGDGLILSLVGGDSKEAIDASIELAKQEYERIRTETLNQVQAKQEIQEQKRKEERKNNVANVTNPGSTVNEPTFTADDIRKMSPQEYEKNRPMIMKLLKSGQLK